MKKQGDLTVAAPAAGAPSEPDGRRRRSQDSRARIVAAMLELIHGGEISPGAEQVAVRAQVGLRTVFRHFNDMDSLYREMSSVIESELVGMLARPLKGDTWREHVMDLIDRRSQAFEKIGSYKRASDVHRHGSPFLEADHVRLVTALREILKRELPPEIASNPLKLEALDVLMSFEVWSRLRREQGLTQRRAREVLESAVQQILGG